MSQSYYSNGKLLLTGEYVVLDGALSLAVPTTYGQSLKITPNTSSSIHWKSLDEKNMVWFEGDFSFTKTNRGILPQTNFGSKEHDSITQMLVKILNEACTLNTSFLREFTGLSIQTELSFPRDWGLGSSSTLINNIAQWAQVNAFELLSKTFSGSGYDIACAQNDYPILYRLDGKNQIVQKENFNPVFSEKLFFIHLNQKQNSRSGIQFYKKIATGKSEIVQHISNITRKIARCTDISFFEALLEEHETAVSHLLNIPTVKERLFSDYYGTVKSLGAWGGDFVLATGNEDTPKYFKKKGFHTVIPYSKMVL